MKIYVPETMYNALTSRPDWPEIERKMKAMYGESWELVPVRGVPGYDAKGGKEADL